MTGEEKNFVCFVYWFNVKFISKKQVEKLSRKLYNNRDKMRSVVLWQIVSIRK